MLINYLIFGYTSKVPEIARMLDGSGIVSMVKVSYIVCLSSSFSGLFKGTHMLDVIKETIETTGQKLPQSICLLMVSIITCTISCNQTLATILTNQLCDGLIKDNSDRALALENGPVIIAPLFPWSIAGAVPIAVLGADQHCIPFAFYLFIIPIWYIFYDIWISKKRHVH